MPHIQFDAVEKHFGKVKALPPLNLSLDNGEFTVLVGPSGCGKSTTLRLLAGLESLSAGEIYFDDKPISQLPAKARDIAMVFQDYALYPHMDVAKNMSFALRLDKTPKAQIQQKVNEVADVLGIAHLLSRKPADLSGGQRQRVAMGRALVRDASTFLFDEPLSNLDAKLRAKLRNELATMRDTLNKNMIYVTHDQVEAMTLGQRIVVMSDGVVQQQGTPETLYQYPVNRFVAGFIGSPSMNFIDAVWENHGEYAKLSETQLSITWHQPPIQLDSGKRVQIGFRPNRATAVDHVPEGCVGFDTTVAVVEYLGASSLVVCYCGKTELQIELPEGQTVKPQTTLKLAVPFADLYLFDADSGNTLFPISHNN